MNEREWADVAKRVQENLQREGVDDREGSIAASIIHQIGTDRRQELIQQERQQRTTKPQSVSIEGIKADLKRDCGEDTLAKLDFSTETDCIRVTPKGFLGKPLYAKVARVLEGYIAQYVSQGKESHWRVPK